MLTKPPPQLSLVLVEFSSLDGYICFLVTLGPSEKNESEYIWIKGFNLARSIDGA
jgi:hypothetical protein